MLRISMWAIVVMDALFVAANIYEYVANGHHWYSLAATVFCALCGLWCTKMAIEIEAY